MKRGVFLWFAVAVAATSFPSTQAFSQALQLPAPEVLQPRSTPRIEPPPRSTPFRLEGAPLTGAEPGGQTFVLKSVEITGNTLFKAGQLAAITQAYIAKNVDLAKLQEMANEISQFYRKAGFPFSTAYLPEQDIRDGIVKIEVLEGRVGRVTSVLAPALDPANQLQEQRNRAVEDVMRIMGSLFSVDEIAGVIAQIDKLFAARMAKEAEKYAAVEAKKVPLPKAEKFASGLKAGEVITSKEVERAALVLDDLPGYVAVPVIRPGAIPGTGDLEFRMVEDKAFIANLGYDNYGSDVSGRNRFKVDLIKARAIVFGDVIRLTALATDRDTSVTTLSYEFPLAANGLRLNLNALKSDYALGQQFSALNEKGDSSAYGFALSYPIVRSQAANLRTSLGYTQSTSENRGLQYVTSKRTDVRAIPLTLSFDFRDQAFGDSAVTYGAATANFSEFDVKSFELAPGGVKPAQKISHTRSTVDIGRLQRMGSSLAASFRYSAQFAPNTIDQSGYFAIGGPGSVRAFPLGEVSGPNGWFSQVELRYTVASYGLTPYLFYDTGTVNKTKASNNTKNRTLAGHGLGLKYNRWGIDLDMVAAWDAEGGPSVEKVKGGTSPLFWVSVSKFF